MADKANKRSQAQKEADMELIARERTRGRSLLDIVSMIRADITRPYELSLSQVRADYLKVVAMWRENAQDYVQAGKARIVAELDAVIVEAWDSFEKSKAERTLRRVKRKSGVTGDAGGTEQTVQTEVQNGDPRFLEVITNCVDKKAKVLGVIAPTKVTMTDPSGRPLTAAPALVPIMQISIPDGSYDPFTNAQRFTGTDDPGTSDN